jgi:N-acetylneuraminate synthase
MKKLKDINVIAEVGLAHEGSMTLALSYIDAIAKSGADAVKFQTHIADSESTKFDKFRIKSIYVRDFSRLEYWKRTSFSLNEWIILKKYAEKKGLLFLSSPFSIEAYKLLEKINIKAWKIGSGEVNNLPLIEKIAKTRKPIFLSSGMSTYQELDYIINIIKKFNNNITLMQCTSMYPCPINKSGINLLGQLKKKFNLPVGYSDHTAQLGIQIAAFAMGAQTIETHVIFDKKIKILDAPVSINFSELTFLCEQIKYLKLSLRSNFNKIKLDKKILRNKFLFEKSIFLKKNIISGKKIKFSDLDFRKPANGILARDFRLIIGKKIKKSKRKGSFLKKNDILI